MPMMEISKAGLLIPLARQQGIPLNEEEADVILGHLKSHDQILLTNEQGQTVLHDSQMGNDCSEDLPHSIWDIICFICDINDDLLDSEESAEEPDEAFLSELRKASHILTGLLAKVS